LKGKRKQRTVKIKAVFGIRNSVKAKAFNKDIQDEKDKSKESLNNFHSF